MTLRSHSRQGSSQRSIKPTPDSLNLAIKDDRPNPYRRIVCVHVLTLVLGFYSYTAFAETRELEKETLILGTIGDFAERICVTIPLEGSSSSTELSGKAKADLTGVMSKIAELGIQGAAKYHESQYQGMLQKDLYAATRDSTDCKLKVSTILMGKLLGATAAASPRLPAEVREELSNFVIEGINLRRQLESRRAQDVKMQIRDDISAWHKKVETYLEKPPLGRTYVARFNNTKRSAITLEGNPSDGKAWNSLNSDLERLDEFIKE